MTLIIRNAERTDYAFLNGIFKMANREHVAMRPDLYRPVDVAVPRAKFMIGITLRDLFNMQPVSLQIAELDKQKVGAVFVEAVGRSVLSWSKFPTEANLENVVVLPEFRRRGIGTKLIDAAKDWAQVNGHKHMHAKIINGNAASTAMFEKAGFQRDSSYFGINLG